MTKKERTILIILFILAFLIKEKIYELFFMTDTTLKTSINVCQIKNEDMEAKLKELENSYNYIDTIPYHLEASKVLYRDIYNLNNTITIYKGSKQGVKEKNLVINEDGLVGIISKVNESSSVVDLLTKKDVTLSVKINDQYGILQYENEELVIKGINNKGSVLVGDKIYTSDVSLYPEKIFIGVIKEIAFDNYEIEKIIKVAPSVSFDNIKYVSILTDLRSAE